MLIVRLAAIVIALSVLCCLRAQSQAPAFVPYTISQEQHQALMNYLGDVPAKFANPLINQLTQFEQAAQAEAAKKAQQESKPPDNK